MADYTNPMSGFTPSAGLPMIYQGRADEERRLASLPFLQNARSLSDMDVAKTQLQNSEFASPEAINTRMMQQRALGQQAQTTVENEPQRRSLENLTLQGQVQQQPTKNQMAMEQLGQQYAELKGKPERDIIDAGASAYMMLKDQPPMVRPQMYQQIIQHYEQTHPGLKIPEKYRTYNENLLKVMNFMKTAGDFEQQKKMQQVNTEVKGRETVAGINAGAGIKEANIRAASAKTVAEIGAGSRETSDKLYLKLLRSAADGTIKPEERDMLPSLIEDQFNKTPEAKKLSDMYGLAAMQGDEKMLTNIRNAQRTAKRAWLEEKGLTKHMPQTPQATTSKDDPLGIRRK